jgi:hypothetical protein
MIFFRTALKKTVSIDLHYFVTFLTRLP